MRKAHLLLAMVALFCAGAAAADIGAGTWSVGYDEGLSGKVFVAPALSINAGVGYGLVGADTILRQSMNSLQIKAGCAYLLKDLDKVRANAFIDLFGRLNQHALVHTQLADRYDEVYTVWDLGVRLGLAPELFIAENLSFTYKFGVEYYYQTTGFKFNADESGLTSTKSEHSVFGTYGLGADAPLTMLNSISLCIYF